METITAIPTTYNGVQLRSRMEAQCAFLFDRLGWNWEYETYSIMLPNGVSFTPDFWLPEIDVVVECRGYESWKGRRQIQGLASLVQRAGGFEVPSKRWYVNDFLVVGPRDIARYSSSPTSEENELSGHPPIIRLCGCGWELLQHNTLYCFGCESSAIACIALSVKRGKISVNGSPVEEFSFPVHPSPRVKPNYCLEYDLDGAIL
jgi:hypothetical protein